MPFSRNGACGTGVLVYWITYGGERGMYDAPAFVDLCENGKPQST
jgi:hypothetical protein